MEFKVDKHGQLRILTGEDIVIDPNEPDVLVLSRDQTEALAELLFMEAFNAK